MSGTLKRNHERAVAEFVGIMGEIGERLDELKEFFDDHMGCNPEELNYGHVGTAESFLAELKELTDRAYNRGEYAE
jgi:hypothetical protein